MGYALAYDRWWFVEKLITDENVDEPVQCMRRPILRRNMDNSERERASALRKRLAAGKKPPKKDYEAATTRYEVVDDDDAEFRAKLKTFNRCFNYVFEEKHGLTPLLASIRAGSKALVKEILSRKPELVGQPRNVRANWPLADRYDGMRVDITPFAYALMHDRLAMFKLVTKHARGHAVRLHQTITSWCLTLARP
jgi:hypothetical protein